MSNEIATQNDAQGFLAVIERIASDPNSDVSKLEKMLDMQERIMTKNAEIAFNQAMTRLQPKLPEIKKSSQGHNTKYAKYEDIEREIRPLYTSEGFSITYTSKLLDSGTEVYYGTISHASGHSRTAEIALPADTSGGKNAIQAKGSTVSYAKRYLLMMLLNIVTSDEDDDGAKGGAKIIDLEAAADLDNRINKLNDAKDYKPKFLKYMRVNAVQDISSRDYLKAVNALKAKEKNNASA